MQTFDKSICALWHMPHLFSYFLLSRLFLPRVLPLFGRNKPTMCGQSLLLPPTEVITSLAGSGLAPSISVTLAREIGETSKEFLKEGSRNDSLRTLGHVAAGEDRR